MSEGALVVRFDTAGDREPLPEVGEGGLGEDVGSSQDDRGRSRDGAIGENAPT